MKKPCHFERQLKKGHQQILIQQQLYQMTFSSMANSGDPWSTVTCVQKNKKNQVTII